MGLDTYEAFRQQPALWLEAVIDIARAHELPSANVTVFPNGSNLIVALSERLVLKVFPPMLRHQFVSERLSLTALHGKLDVPIPEIVLEGERDGWPYLCITRLHGRSGEEVWPTLSEPEKERVLLRIGELIARVQSVPPGELLTLEPSWQRFVPQQIAGCRARHERLGLPQRYVDGLEDYLADASVVVPTQVAPVMLTGEYIPENFMLEVDADGPTISGLIDFGDVMTGWGEYDLLGPSTFMGGGRKGRIRSLLRGFGYADADWSPASSRRLMTLFLLHRYSDVCRQVHIPNWQERATTLPALEELIWPR